MKTTIKNIANMIEVLSSISTNNFKINYWIYRNTENLKSSYNFLVENRSIIYEEYLIPDEEGNIITIEESGNYKFNLKETTPEFAKEFGNKMNELFSLECEVDIYSIDVNTLIKENISLTPAQISYIGCLLSE